MKRLEEQIFGVLMLLSTAIVMFSLLLILGTIVVKGLPALSLDMITKAPESGYYLGGGGGILNAIVGSLLLAAGASVVSMIFGIPVALYLNIYLTRKSKLAEVIRVALDVMCGVPSIVYGAFGFAIMLYLGVRASLLGGIIAVSLLIMPVMIRAIDEVVRLVPHELIEASYSVGANRFETVFKVVVRQTLPGIISAVLLGFGRGIGDAASVLFTTGFTDRISFSLLEPVATLPLAIFFQLGTPLPEVQQRAYASAFILTVIILVLSLSARFLVSRYGRHMVK
ncbi:MAG: phosphate ABC transporter permease PstA [Kiritimatiellae bacterium]|nr:phosphate ABC transporter permease PstA [Kiritimatiellia bacterium]MDD5522711.1 phosphate ABC transporter permease PstA [Kiritimatiellia bacterium]